MRCRRAQSQFDPLRRALTEQITYEAQPEKRPHGQYQQRHGHNGTDQEPAPEVDQLGVGPPSPLGTPMDSRAMPHFGQSPGASRMVSECIGQVYYVPADAGAVA